MFRDSFKYYKSRVPPPNLSQVIDLDNPDYSRVKRIPPIDDEFFPNEKLGLKLPKSWEISTFVDIPGLVFVKNPFTPLGQRYWITKCVKDYSRKPNRLNLDAHNFLDKNENWWDICTRDDERAKTLVAKLRWATLGYHHNWETKHYTEDSRNDIPIELSDMTRALARVIGCYNFKAEAAIVNYYRMNSTLAGHTDHSEIDQRAPLFSISFGQSAIFLIGGSRQEEPANALLLRSGDVVIMNGESRLRYHGIPKILPANLDAPWESDDRSEESSSCEDWQNVRNFIAEARINLNVRQVLKPGELKI